MSAAEPPEPTFASPTPPGVLPAPGLAHVALPGVSPDSRAVDDGRDRSGRSGRPASSGHSGRDLSPRARRRARVAAWCALAAVVVAVGSTLAVSMSREHAWAAVTADLDAPAQVNAVQLVLGSCVDLLPDDGSVGQVRAVPCDSPHGAQVVGRQDAEPAAVWPGDDDAVRAASATCGPQLLGTDGRKAEDELHFVVWAPTEDSWADGDRTGLCLAESDSARPGSLLD